MNNFSKLTTIITEKETKFFSKDNIEMTKKEVATHLIKMYGEPELVYLKMFRFLIKEFPKQAEQFERILFYNWFETLKPIIDKLSKVTIRTNKHILFEVIEAIKCLD